MQRGMFFKVNTFGFTSFLLPHHSTPNVYILYSTISGKYAQHAYCEPKVKSLCPTQKLKAAHKLIMPFGQEHTSSHLAKKPHLGTVFIATSLVVLLNQTPCTLLVPDLAGFVCTIRLVDSLYTFEALGDLAACRWVRHGLVVEQLHARINSRGEQARGNGVYTFYHLVTLYVRWLAHLVDALAAWAS